MTNDDVGENESGLTITREIRWRMEDENNNGRLINIDKYGQVFIDEIEGGDQSGDEYHLGRVEELPAISRAIIKACEEWIGANMP